jgi:hypothetical protein
MLTALTVDVISDDCHSRHLDMDAMHIDDSVDNSADTILSRYDMKNWKKLEEDHGLVQLHRKFWHQKHQHNQLVNLNPQSHFDEDNDVDSDCFVLDHGIPLIFNAYSKVWVRKEYLRIYKLCNDHLDTVRNKGPLRSLVITGQPELVGASPCDITVIEMSKARVTGCYMLCVDVFSKRSLLCGTTKQTSKQSCICLSVMVSTSPLSQNPPPFHSIPVS